MATWNQQSRFKQPTQASLELMPNSRSGTMKKQKGALALQSVEFLKKKVIRRFLGKLKIILQYIPVDYQTIYFGSSIYILVSPLPKSFGLSTIIAMLKAIIEVIFEALSQTNRYFQDSNRDDCQHLLTFQEISYWKK